MADPAAPVAVAEAAAEAWEDPAPRVTRIGSVTIHGRPASNSQQLATPAVPMQRSVSAPGAADSGIEAQDPQHSFFSPTGDSSAVPAHDAGATGSDDEMDMASLPPPPLPPSTGHGHEAAAAVEAAHSYAHEPQTPNAVNTQSVAAELLGAAAGTYAHLGAVERRNSRPNLRLQAHQPPKLVPTAALAVPSSASMLLPPASPMTPIGGGPPPPNTPMDVPRHHGSSSNADLLTPLGRSSGGGVAGDACPSPVFDQPFTPVMVPMSPMLPQAPPPSPFPQPARSPSESAGSSSGMSPLISPATSPHPIRQVMHLPSIMSGEDVLEHPDEQEEEQEKEKQRQLQELPQPPSDAPADDSIPPPPPEDDAVPPPASSNSSTASPTLSAAAAASSSPVPRLSVDEAAAAFEGELANFPLSPRDGRDTLEVVVKHAEGAEAVRETPLLLHRSRLGRLSIIHRTDVAASALPDGLTVAGAPAATRALSPTRHASGSVSAASVPSPTAIAHLSEQEIAKKSLTCGPVVTSVVRVQHVTFNPNDDSSSAQLASIPDEWKEALKRQFGLPPNLQPSQKLPAYPGRIPQVLLRMADCLRASGAIERQVGIFRLAPDQAECARLKAALDTHLSALDAAQVAKAQYNDLAACCANLIKTWFRELPAALFHSIPVEQLSALNTATPAAQLEKLISTHLREPHQSIYRWLLDLCCDVTLHSDTNKMIAKNLAICIGPNLYTPPVVGAPAAGAASSSSSSRTSGGGKAGVGGAGAQQSASEAMKIIQQCKYYTTFLELCIGMREEQRGQKRTTEGA